MPSTARVVSVSVSVSVFVSVFVSGRRPEQRNTRSALRVACCWHCLLALAHTVCGSDSPGVPALAVTLLHIAQCGCAACIARTCVAWPCRLTSAPGWLSGLQPEYHACALASECNWHCVRAAADLPVLSADHNPRVLCFQQKQGARKWLGSCTGLQRRCQRIPALTWSSNLQKCQHVALCWSSSPA